MEVYSSEKTTIIGRLSIAAFDYRRVAKIVKRPKKPGCSRAVLEKLGASALGPCWCIPLAAGDGSRFGNGPYATWSERRRAVAAMAAGTLKIETH
jgi:hypothetical protein